MRKSERIVRITGETEISAQINLDGSGNYSINTGIGFFNHMLELFSKHSGIDITLDAKGDIDVDFHHTVEDTAIVLGEALSQALGDKKGIERYASLALPMDETLVDVALDISGRPNLVYKADVLTAQKVGEFDTELAYDFFKAFAMNAKITLHIDVRYGINAHHIIEGMFKGLARTLKTALRITGDDIPSTKGIV